ncbi:hypothetical protein ERUR111494_08430 [Erysipelothrix urinaevulpis]|uniref:hypothetical protein n=1 Tax=Erysipelothrix urinaevulpis TaxID=2683717 RepID=UPI001356ECCF|nr:hypothetical protein [Erysipelothrix urinaevulpis]
MKTINKVLAVSAIAVGTAYVLKKVLEKDIIQDKFKEKDAMAYLKEKYGDEALDGKKILIVRDEDHPTKATIAKDVVDYSIHKED